MTNNSFGQKCWRWKPPRRFSPPQLSLIAEALRQLDHLVTSLVTRRKLLHRRPSAVEEVLPTLPNPLATLPVSRCRDPLGFGQQCAVLNRTSRTPIVFGLDHKGQSPNTWNPSSCGRKNDEWSFSRSPVTLRSSPVSASRLRESVLWDTHGLHSGGFHSSRVESRVRRRLGEVVRPPSSCSCSNDELTCWSISKHV